MWSTTICKLALTVNFLTCCFMFQTLGLARQNYQVWLAIFFLIGRTNNFAPECLASLFFVDSCLAKPGVGNVKQQVKLLTVNARLQMVVWRLAKFSSADCIWIGWAVLPGWHRHEERLKIDFKANAGLHMSRTKCKFLLRKNIYVVSSSFQFGLTDKFGVWPNQANFIHLVRSKLSPSLFHVEYGARPQPKID